MDVLLLWQMENKRICEDLFLTSSLKKAKFSYITYIRKQLARLFELNCHVIFVIDGQPLPAKKVFLLQSI